MKQYKVDLNVIAPKNIKEDEICNMLNGITYFLEDKYIKNNILWILDFELDKFLSIEEQIRIIVSHLDQFQIKNMLTKGIKIIFDIQIYYDTYSCSFEIPCGILQNMNTMLNNIELSFSLYPTDFDEEYSGDSNSSKITPTINE